MDTLRFPFIPAHRHIGSAWVIKEDKDAIVNGTWQASQAVDGGEHQDRPAI